jgi:hypothetical protein
MDAERGEAFRAGELIGGTLHVEALLGEGGSGAVYRVKDERNGQQDREFAPVLLAGKHLGEEMIAGVAALDFCDDERPALHHAMLDAVIEALIAQDVVDPITCVA